MSVTAIPFADAVAQTVFTRPTGIDRSVVCAMLADAIALPDVDYVAMGDYAVGVDEIMTGASGSATLTGKELRSAISQATGALPKEERPQGGVPSGASTFAMLETVFGLTADTGKRHARVVVNLPTYREWAGLSDTDADSVALADGAPVMTVTIKDQPHTILRPTGKVIGMAIEWSAFRKALAMFAPAGAVSVKAPTVLGIKPSGKRYTVTTYVALEDAIKVVARLGLRTVNQPAEAGALILPSIPKDIATLDNQTAAKARAAVKEYHAEIRAAVDTFMGGDAMPKVSEMAKAVAVGAYWESILTRDGRATLAQGARLHGTMSARN